MLWYFSIIPRFRRIYRNAKDAKHLTWHEYERVVVVGMLRHLADSPQWIFFYHDYPYFRKEERNLCLALSIDTINPHGIQSSKHTTWAAIMKLKYMMLTMLIRWLYQPRNDIGIYILGSINLRSKAYVIF